MWDIANQALMRKQMCVLGLAYEQWLKGKALICLTWQHIGIGSPGLVRSRNQPLSSPFLLAWDMAAMPQGPHSLQTGGRKMTRGLTSVYISLTKNMVTPGCKGIWKGCLYIPNSLSQKGKGSDWTWTTTSATDELKQILEFFVICLCPKLPESTGL